MHIVWLSHPIKEDTPLYGGASNLKIRADKSLAQGDSCNTKYLAMSNHSGTHVDVPLHFFPNGRNLSTFPAATWVFRRPVLIDLRVPPGTLLSPDKFPLDLPTAPSADLVLIRTGAEKYRHHENYWKQGPGLASEVAEYLAFHYPNLQAVGMDTISISSLKHREAGRAAHREFLGRGWRLFEDMAMAAVPSDRSLALVVALPLRLLDGDGAPCAIIGFIAQEKENHGEH